jgi:hypothetical protein
MLDLGRKITFPSVSNVLTNCMPHVARREQLIRGTRLRLKPSCQAACLTARTVIFFPLYVHGGLFQLSLVRGERRFTLEMSVTVMFNIKVFRHSTLLYHVPHDERETYLDAVRKLMGV